jgi:predicted DNA-binding protein (MmcQ/YjbR family)
LFEYSDLKEQRNTFKQRYSLYSCSMPSYIDWARSVCLALPNTTEKIQWVHDLLFCIGGKMYCVVNLEPGLGPTKIALKCTPERFAELAEIEGIIPAPYMARNYWVAFTKIEALRRDEIKNLIHRSYQLVLEKLPKKLQLELASSRPQRGSKAKKKARRATAK